MLLGYFLSVLSEAQVQDLISDIVFNPWGQSVAVDSRAGSGATIGGNHK
jgi:hypothetical protein